MNTINTTEKIIPKIFIGTLAIIGAAVEVACIMLLLFYR